MSARTPRYAGYSLLEILITMVVLAVGLLGVAGLQARAQHAELESYQRSQALVLLDDMADRINTNRGAARCYAVTNNDGSGTPYLGEGATASTSCSGWGTAATREQADDDLAQWNNMLQGTSETRNNTAVGTMEGARGCVTYSTTAGGNDQYTITIAWQGQVDTGADNGPPCAGGAYGGRRRTVSTTIEFAELT